MTTFIKRGDTKPSFEKRLRSSSGEPEQFTDSDVVSIHIRDENYNVIVSDDTTGNVNVTDKETGVVEYNWQSGDTSDIGSYKAEFVVDFNSGGSRSYPADGYYDIEITEDIDD